MSESSLTLQATTRTQVGRQSLATLRNARQVPAVVYGHNFPNQSLTVDLNAVTRIYQQAGESTIVELQIDNESSVPVLIHDVQFDTLGHTISHLDFYHVRMDEVIRTEVELVFENVAPAVKELGGILVKNITHLAIECLPKDLPHDLKVDNSVLKTFDDNILVRDISLPTGVTVTNQAEDVVASVVAPRTTEELEALDSAVVEDVAAVEVQSKAKPEEQTESAA